MIRYRLEVMCDCCGDFDQLPGTNWKKRQAETCLLKEGWAKFPKGRLTCPKCTKLKKVPTETM